MNRVVNRETVKYVEPGKLIDVDQTAQIRAYIECGFSQIYVYTVYNAINEFFKLAHEDPPDPDVVLLSSRVHSKPLQCLIDDLHEGHYAIVWQYSTRKDALQGRQPV